MNNIYMLAYYSKNLYGDDPIEGFVGAFESYESAINWCNKNRIFLGTKSYSNSKEEMKRCNSDWIIKNINDDNVSSYKEYWFDIYSCPLIKEKNDERN